MHGDEGRPKDYSYNNHELHAGLHAVECQNAR